MTQSKASRVVVVVLHAVLVGIAAGCTASEGFRVDQGIIAREFSEAGDLAKWSLAERTTQVSKSVLVNQSGPVRKGLGYVIAAPPSMEYFEIHSVSRLPGIPEKVGGSLAKNSSAGDAINGLSTSPQMFHKVGYEAFDLDESDPLGEYRIDVFADGKFITTLVFEVKP